MRGYLIAVLLMLVSSSAYAQTNLSVSPQASTPVNGAVSINGSNWQIGSGGQWVNMNGGATNTLPTIVPAVHCDGVQDDSGIINTAISGAPAGSVVQLPSGKNCAIASGIVLTTAVGFDGNGSKLTSSMTASGTAAMTISSVTPGANYAGNRVPYRNINLIGPGSSSVNWGVKGAGTIGLKLQASNIDIVAVNITGFNNGITYGNNSYMISTVDPQIYSNYWGVFYPFPAPTTSGENLNFYGGSVFNNTIGFEDDGGSSSEFHFQATSFDYNSTQVIPVGNDSFDHIHLEGITAAPFSMAGGYNNFSHLRVTHSEIVFGSSTPSSSIPLINITGTGGMYAKFDHIFLSGFQQTNVLGNWITGAGAANVSVCYATDTFLSATAVDNLGPFGNCPPPLPVSAANGGSGLGPPTQFSLLYGNGATSFGTLLLTDNQLVLGHTGSAPTGLSVADCSADGTHADQWNATTHSFQCAAITATAAAQGTAGAVQYNNPASPGSLAGLNGTGLVLLNGASAPTALAGNTLAANNFANSISAAGVISGAQVNFTNLAGSVAAAQMPALTGDTTTSAGATVTTTGKVNGVTYPASPSTHQVPVITAANTSTYKTVPDCQDSAGNHINYTQSSDTFSCGTTTPSTGLNNAIVPIVAYGGI